VERLAAKEYVRQHALMIARFLVQGNVLEQATKYAANTILIPA